MHAFRGSHGRQRPNIRSNPLATRYPYSAWERIVMQPGYGRLMLAAAVAVSVWTVWPYSPVAGVAPSASNQVAASAPDGPFVGVASCTSMACHHKSGPKGSKGSEYTTWRTFDAHAKAYTDLYEL